MNDKEFLEMYKRYEPERRTNYINIETKIENLNYNPKKEEVKNEYKR